MPTLNIGGQRIKVGDDFLRMSPDQQNAAVEEIAASLPKAAPQPFDNSRFDLVKGSGDMGTGGLSAFGRGAAQGASVGLADELSAAAAASPLPMAADRNQGRIPNAIDTIAGGVRLGLERVAPGTFGQGGTQAAQDRFAKEAMMNDMASHDRFWTNIAGNVVGGAAVPLGTVNSVRSGAATGAGLGAAYGFSTGSDLQNRTEQAVTGGAVGGVLGGALGGVAGALSRPAPAAGATGQDVVAAGERLGVPVPKFIASDSIATQRTAAGLKNVPFAGDPIVKGSARFNEGLGTAADEISGQLGGGDRINAGQVAARAITDWIGPRSKTVVTNAYDAVDNAVSPSARADLAQTRNVVSDILAKRANSQIQGDSKAVNEVIAAVKTPGGMNYQGIKDLRSYLGEFQSKGILPEGMSSGELKRIYGALTDDMRNIIQTAGGQRGLSLWERANSLNSAVAKRREELAKIVGKDGNAAPEMVFDRLAAFASDKGGANIGRLVKARNTMTADEWNEVGSAIIQRMGRDAQDEFSPNRFVTSWGRLSDAGKAVIFPDKTHRAALDDLMTLSVRGGPAMARFGNPSGTAQNTAFVGGVGAGVFLDFGTTLATVLSGRVMASALAAPASASSMAKMARAYSIAVEKPSAATYAGLQSAVRNFSNTASDKLGVNINPQDLLRGLISGPKPSPAVEQPQTQNQ
jgi:hypothetical protein